MVNINRRPAIKEPEQEREIVYHKVKMKTLRTAPVHALTRPYAIIWTLLEMEIAKLNTLDQALEMVYPSAVSIYWNYKGKRNYNINFESKWQKIKSGECRK